MLIEQLWALTNAKLPRMPTKAFSQAGVLADSTSDSDDIGSSLRASTFYRFATGVAGSIGSSMMSLTSSLACSGIAATGMTSPDGPSTARRRAFSTFNTHSKTNVESGF